MTDWLCPTCRGGFPEAVLDDGCCPWCGHSIDGSYEPPTVHSISKVESDEPEGGPIYQRLFGWLD